MVKKLRLFRFFSGKEAFWDDPSYKILFEDGFYHIEEGPMTSLLMNEESIPEIKNFAQNLQGTEIKWSDRLPPSFNPCLLFDPYTNYSKTHLTIYFSQGGIIIRYMGPYISLSEKALKRNKHRILRHAFLMLQDFSGRADLDNIYIKIGLY